MGNNQKQGGIKHAIEAGVTSIEHGMNLTDELIQSLSLHVISNPVER
ncbi:MAG: hypothetical protein WCD86_13055 [Ktedonobacteraceae bacterium]